MRRRLFSWLLRSSLVAVGGCNAIVGTQDISYVEPPSTPSPAPSSTSTPPPAEGDGDASVVGEPDSAAGFDAEVGDAGIEEGSDGGVSGDF
jgi:hypothetical protein